MYTIICSGFKNLEMFANIIKEFLLKLIPIIIKQNDETHVTQQSLATMLPKKIANIIIGVKKINIFCNMICVRQ